MLTLMLVAVLGQSPELPAKAGDLPVVEQSVETISVAHLNDGVELVFFWTLVQGEWTCLDHRWVSTNMVVTRDRDGWLLAWPDESENCYRMVRATCWVESWESESPLAEQNQRPWFRQLLNPGLKQPSR